MRVTLCSKCQSPAALPCISIGAFKAGKHQPDPSSAVAACTRRSPSAPPAGRAAPSCSLRAGCGPDPCCPLGPAEGSSALAGMPTARSLRFRFPGRWTEVIRVSYVSSSVSQGALVAECRPWVRVPSIAAQPPAQSHVKLHTPAELHIGLC